MERDLFRLTDVRKTYGVSKIPETLFRECRLNGGQRPVNGSWREVCGSHDA